jgi:TolB-like protein
MGAGSTAVLRDPSRPPEDFIHFPFGARSQAWQKKRPMHWLFDDCVLDVERRELCRGGAVVAIEPQVFDLLVYLIRNRARVVSKDDLLGSVWQGRAVSDSALANRINAARAAVGDNGEEQKLIRTFPRKGFRFVGKVVEGSPQQVLTSLGGDGPQLPLPEQPSLVVLPFTDMSPDRKEGHFADGITEDLITELARIRWLFVIARNSAFAYKDRAVDVKQISQELGVRYVLEGSVRRSGQRMRINAQLVDATSGVHQWAERYDRDAGEIFAVQDEITSSVAAAVEPHLLAAEGRRAAFLSRADLGAWQLVARAQSQFWRLTREDYEASVASLQQAIERSPDFAPAQALMGFALVFAAHMGWVDKSAAVPIGRQHAERAIALDDRNPWGYSALGYAAMMQRRTEESIAAFRKTVALTPSSATAHGHLSHGLAFAGFADEAIKHGEIAIRLSPLDPEMARFLGGIAIAHYTARHFDEAVYFTKENLRLRPGFQGAQRLHCASLAQSGRLEDARAFLSTIRQTHRPPLTIDWVRNNVPYQTPELMELFLEGLRKAGLKD